MSDINETCFERAIFFSWACKLDECCKYCYMSTIPKEKRTGEKVRSFASLLADTIITRELGWDYGFLSGGLGVFSDEKMVDLLKKTNSIMAEPIWINTGVLSKKQLELFQPNIRGVVGTIEVLNPVLHKKVCPSKPIEPVEKMFESAKELKIARGMTLIVGLGETISDFSLLKDFIKKHDISKIHIYGLNPQEGTEFENANPPSVEYQSEWIIMTRKAFPNISIQAGIWEDRVEYVGPLLSAGANSISKFPALKVFGSLAAKEVERQAKLAGRKFKGTLTKLPDIDWDKKADALDDKLFSQELKSDIKKKLRQYLVTMNKNKLK
jgi:biotin synthase-like enzyme